MIAFFDIFGLSRFLGKDQTEKLSSIISTLENIGCLLKTLREEESVNSERGEFNVDMRQYQWHFVDFSDHRNSDANRRSNSFFPSNFLPRWIFDLGHDGRDQTCNYGWTWVRFFKSINRNSTFWKFRTIKIPFPGAKSRTFIGLICHKFIKLGYLDREHWTNSYSGTKCLTIEIFQS